MTTSVCVEGQSDIKLFRKLLDGEKCKVEQIPGGNEKVEDCVATFLTENSLVIGIRDADFLKFSGEQYTKPNMFLTDCHDIEMTMLAQPSIVFAVHNEYLDHNDAQAQEHLASVMNGIKQVSGLKWLNVKEDFGFACSKTAFVYLVDLEALQLDFYTYWQRLLANSQNAKIVDKQVIEDKLEELLATSVDLWQLTNGHDLVATLVQYFKTIGKVDGVTERSIASTLRVAYTKGYFQQTQLYQQLLIWQNDNNASLIVNS